MSAPDRIWAAPDQDDGWRWLVLSRFSMQGYSENVSYVRLDPNTRVVTVGQLELWADEWEKTVSMAQYSCAIDRKMIDEIRAIIGEVKP